ncbi:amidohydrolase family protein [uncultured Ruegeria sp.]|uniref:amidohydrolase family protein n=1 Tax=uncultured Ruegeria sp. TaxID=259304 RepID=UPI00261056A1|nr:amidohydrolase family protein [uncultured Ruegeria sp.]
MNRREIIDPHHHLWDLANPYPWLQNPMGVGVGGDLNAIAQNYLLSDYLRDCSSYDLRGAVHVEADYERSRAEEETTWVQSILNGSEIATGLVVYAPLQNSNVGALLDTHLSNSAHVKGVRQILCWHQKPQFCFVDDPSLMDSAAWRRGLNELAKRNLSFDLMVYQQQLNQAHNVIAAHPDVFFVINHTAMPEDRSTAGFAQWRDDLKRVSNLPNVAIKISGLGQTDWAWTEASLRPYVLEAIEIFGPKRAMFASNFPVDKAYSSFDRLYGAFESITKDFGRDEQQNLFHDTAKNIYRL